MSNVDLSPLLQVLGPILQDLALAAITAGVGYFATRFHVWTGKDMADSDKAALQSALDTAAGVIFASSSAGISAAAINTSTPAVADQVNHVLSYLPKLVAATGETPDSIARAIVGKLGALQAASPTSTTTNVVPPAGSTTTKVGDVMTIEPAKGVSLAGGSPAPVVTTAALTK